MARRANSDLTLAKLAGKFPHWEFPKYWGKRGLRLKYRYMLQPLDDSQIPRLGCICCGPSGRSSHVVARSRNFVRKEDQFEVKGMEASEYFRGWLYLRLSKRVHELQRPSMREAFELSLQGKHVQFEYEPYVHFPQYVLAAPISLSIGDRKFDAAHPILNDNFMGRVPIRVGVTRRTALFRSIAVTGAVWEDQFVPKGGLPLPKQILRHHYVVSATDLKKGLGFLWEWLVFGARLSEANRELAELCTNWLFPGIRNGARTGRSKVATITRQLYHPCPKHCPLLADLFHWDQDVSAEKTS